MLNGKVEGRGWGFNREPSTKPTKPETRAPMKRVQSCVASGCPCLLPSGNGEVDGPGKEQSFKFVPLTCPRGRAKQTRGTFSVNSKTVAKRGNSRFNRKPGNRQQTKTAKTGRKPCEQMSHECEHERARIFETRDAGSGRRSGTARCKSHAHRPRVDLWSCPTKQGSGRAGVLWM